MKKIILTLIIGIFCLPLSIFADEFNQTAISQGIDPATGKSMSTDNQSTNTNTQNQNNTDNINGFCEGADCAKLDAQVANGNGNSSSSSASKTMTVIVTEEIPGGDCKCIAEESATTSMPKADGNGTITTSTNIVSCGNPATRKYSCTVKTGLDGFQKTFAELIRYSIYIVMLLGVLGIVGLGIAWAFAGGDDVKAKTTLKTWGVSIVVGLTILFLFTYILRFLAPWIFQ